MFSCLSVRRGGLEDDEVRQCQILDTQKGRAMEHSGAARLQEARVPGGHLQTVPMLWAKSKARAHG